MSFRSGLTIATILSSPTHIKAGVRMAAVAVPNLTWQPMGANGTNNTASVVLDSTKGSPYIIKLLGTPSGGDQNRNVLPAFVLLDNIQNNGNVNITIGAVTLVLPPFERETFPIPAGVTQLTIAVTVGTVNCFISEEKLANDQSNNLLVQQTAVKTLIYAFQSATATVSQVAADLNTAYDFVPVAADMSYNLLPTNTPVGNGWTQFIYNLGSKNVSLTPAGADVLAFEGTLYTNANPLVLPPGSAGILQSDGVRWFFFGDNNTTLGLFKSSSVNIAQVSGDKNTAFLFTPNAADIAYSLLSTAAAKNGWIEFIYNDGTKNVSLVPNGGDQLNYGTSAYTAGLPLILYPGAAGILQSDGTQWYFQGAQGRLFNKAHKFVNVNTNQVVDDDNRFIQAFPPGADITYTLLPSASLYDGFSFKIFHDGTANSVTVVAGGGGQDINGAASIVLNHGDAGELTFNGGNSWYFTGVAHFESGEVAANANFILNAAHLLGKLPDLVKVVLRCKVANLSYSVNDEIEISNPITNAAGGISTLAVDANTTNVIVVRDNAIAPIALPDRGTAVATNITLVDWRFVVYAYAFW